ncbi:DUF6308 family protein [Streptomyces sp. NPDC004830]
MREDDAALHHRLRGLRQSAGLPDTDSKLRVADVAVWMSHSGTGPPLPLRTRRRASRVLTLGGGLLVWGPGWPQRVMGLAPSPLATS